MSTHPPTHHVVLLTLQNSKLMCLQSVSERLRFSGLEAIDPAQGGVYV